MNRSRKNGGKDRKSLYKLMKNALYGKTMEHLRNRIDIRPVSNEKYYLRWRSKPIYMSQKIFDNDLVAIRKSKVTLTLNKPAYVGMCILDLRKVLMYKFHYDYIKIKYGNNSRLLFTDTDSLMHEIKTDDVYEYFCLDKKMFIFRNYSTKSKYYDDSNKSVVGKMIDETGGVGIKEYFGLKPKMYSFLVDHSSESKKVKDVNKNAVGKVTHSEYKDVLLNKKCLRHLKKRIQSKDHRIRNHKINKISFSCLDDKIYTLNNEYGRLALGH